MGWHRQFSCKEGKIVFVCCFFKRNEKMASFRDSSMTIIREGSSQGGDSVRGGIFPAAFWLSLRHAKHFVQMEEILQVKAPFLVSKPCWEGLSLWGKKKKNKKN